MKLTKRLLRQIIKEELEEVVGGGGDAKMAQAEEMAKMLSKNPQIMAAVKQAAQDPKVQAAAKKLMQNQAGGRSVDEDLDPEVQYGIDYDAARSGAQTSALTGVLGSIGVAGTALNVWSFGQLGYISASTAAMAPVVGGVVAGAAMAAAVGILVHHHLTAGESPGERAQRRYDLSRRRHPIDEI